MTRKVVLSIVVAFVCALFSTTAKAVEIKYKTHTRGNITFLLFIPEFFMYDLKLSGDEINEVRILDVIVDFEAKHPELEITGTQVQTSHQVGNNTYYRGVWIRHKKAVPKQRQHLPDKNAP